MNRSARSGLLALTLIAGTCAGLALAPSSASALSCEDHHSEELSLELSSIELDGEALALDAASEVAGTWLTRLRPEPGDSVNLNDQDYERWAQFEVDMAIDPSDEVADYIETSEARRTSGRVCSGLPFVAAKPGVYLVDATFSDPDMPEGATLTLDAARESVVIEYSDAEGDYAVRYEVVDFFFSEDRSSGCSVTGSSEPGPAGVAWGLGLLALCAWRRRAPAS